MKTQNVAEHITKWLKDYATNSKQKGYIIGVSGGIDSAVVSTLCARTGLNLILVEMPIHQAEDQVGRAKKHMDWLCTNYPNAKQLSFNLTGVYDAFVDIIDNKTGFISPFQSNQDTEDKMFLTLANARSRMRMTTLYTIAGLNQLLVAGTGNMVEDFGVGFFTKYGDGGIDVSPIGELLKSEVYQLGAELGINEDILKARPTDGLWDDGRTDEDQIGATYDELEWAMTSFNEDESFYADRFDLTPRQKEVLAIYQGRHRANAHKMTMPPICSLKNIK